MKPTVDANGRELKEGDRVLIPAVVTGVGAEREFANINVCTKFDNPIGRVATPLALNSRQVVLDPEPIF